MPVPEGDGTVHVSGDYEVMVNSFLKYALQVYNLNILSLSEIKEEGNSMKDSMELSMSTLE